LRKGSPVLDISGSVKNASKDHRLRLLVHTGIDSDVSLAAQPFDCVERLRYPKQEGLNTDLSQPVAGWVSVKDGAEQVSVLTDGHYDYEYLRDERHSLAFTCVRSTGRITNDLFGANGNGVAQSPEWAAPENQCLRNIPIHLGVRLGEASPAALFREQQCWVSPLLTGFDSVDPHKFMTGRPCVQSADLSEMFFRDPSPAEVCLPLCFAGIELDGDVVFSACKQREDRQGMLLRFFNPAVEEKVVSVKGTGSLQDITLAETTQDNSLKQQRGMEPVLPAKRIRSIGFDSMDG
jgi:alpha-mannosidase